MVDYIADLALKARERVGRGYYNDVQRGEQSGKGLAETIQTAEGTPVITEVKFASPSARKRREHADPPTIAPATWTCGTSAISVLTAADYFQGTFDTSP